MQGLSSYAGNACLSVAASGSSAKPKGVAVQASMHFMLALVVVSGKLSSHAMICQGRVGSGICLLLTS